MTIFRIPWLNHPIISWFIFQLFVNSFHFDENKNKKQKTKQNKKKTEQNNNNKSKQNWKKSKQNKPKNNKDNNKQKVTSFLNILLNIYKDEQIMNPWFHTVHYLQYALYNYEICSKRTRTMKSYQKRKRDGKNKICFQWPNLNLKAPSPIVLTLFPNFGNFGITRKPTFFS